MKFNEVGTTLKHPKTLNGNVKNLSKKVTFPLSFICKSDISFIIHYEKSLLQMKDKGNVAFTLRI